MDVVRKQEAGAMDLVMNKAKKLFGKKTISISRTVRAFAAFMNGFGNCSA